jgi:phosphoglycerate dehydrogenase-like enzyme
MAKTNLLVISPTDNSALRLLAQLQDSADISVGSDTAKLLQLAPAAEVILLSGSAGKSVDFAQVWRQAASVRWVHSLATGVENMLFPSLLASSVPLTNARGVYKRSLAEFAVLGILFHFKRVRRLVDNQRGHQWDNFYVKSANQRIMGVVGYGEIGRECALLAKGLGFRIHALRRTPAKSMSDPIVERAFKPEELRQMLAEIDVLVCAAPLTRETRHMIGAAELNLMKRGAIVINVGRGPVIDEAALIGALRDGSIAGASLDVFEEEPLPQNSPLWDMENVLISPHCTDHTEDPDWQDLSMQAFIENYHRYRSGQALANVVDKKAGY